MKLWWPVGDASSLEPHSKMPGNYSKPWLRWSLGQSFEITCKNDVLVTVEFHQYVQVSVSPRANECHAVLCHRGRLSLQQESKSDFLSKSCNFKGAEKKKEKMLVWKGLFPFYIKWWVFLELSECITAFILTTGNVFRRFVSLLWVLACVVKLVLVLKNIQSADISGFIKCASLLL